jgi:hypothetical protein
MRLAVRAAWLYAYAAWVGGFFFYSSVVVHVMLARAPELPPGAVVTREVTLWLNGLGAAALACWWAEWNLAAPRRPRGQGVLLAFATLLHGALLATHGRVGAAWDADSESFYRWHQAYLAISTTQFFAQVALLPMALARWRGQDRS